MVKLKISYKHAAYKWKILSDQLPGVIDIVTPSKNRLILSNYPHSSKEIKRVPVILKQERHVKFDLNKIKVDDETLTGLCPLSPFFYAYSPDYVSLQLWHPIRQGFVYVKMRPDNDDPILQTLFTFHIDLLNHALDFDQRQKLFKYSKQFLKSSKDESESE